MAAQDSGLTDFMMAFSLGALFGAGLALVLAPQSGDKTRKELGKKSKKWKKEAVKTGGEWLGEAEELVDDWSSDLAEAVEDGLQSIRSAVEDEIGKVEKKLGKKKKGLFR